MFTCNEVRFSAICGTFTSLLSRRSNGVTRLQVIKSHKLSGQNRFTTANLKPGHIVTRADENRDAIHLQPQLVPLAAATSIVGLIRSPR